MEERLYLYRITNKINKRVYIGITVNPKRRKNQHFRGSLAQASIPRLAVEKYGKDPLEFEVLVEGGRSYILDLEIKFISHYKRLGVAYNISAGGEAGNLGLEINYRSDDTPVYVLGFWFPNKRVAARALAKGKTTIYRNLGKEIKTKTSKGKVRPERGSAKDSENRAKSMKGKNVGTSNGMSGRVSGSHPRARKVSIFGVVFDSIAEAVRETSLTKSIIEKSLKKSKDGFEYINK